MIDVVYVFMWLQAETFIIPASPSPAAGTYRRPTFQKQARKGHLLNPNHVCIKSLVRSGHYSQPAISCTGALCMTGS